MAFNLMNCPHCQHTDSRVLESRSTEAGLSIRRRRECLRCQHRFTTYERIEFFPLTVIKRDNSRESFDRSKLLREIIRACEKTGISDSKLETIVAEIEAQFQLLQRREVTSTEIGQLVLKYLRNLSEVAYVRFASVYQQFQGIKDFVALLKLLEEETKHIQTEADSSDSSCLENRESENLANLIT